MVEAARLGHVFAANHDAYRKWTNSQARRGPIVSGDALERAVMRIAEQFPGNVEVIH